VARFAPHKALKSIARGKLNLMKGSRSADVCKGARFPIEGERCVVSS